MRRGLDEEKNCVFVYVCTISNSIDEAVRVFCAVIKVSNMAERGVLKCDL